MKNHGQIKPERLSPGTRQALLLAAQYLREEPGLVAVQVTFDRDCLTGSDAPPTIHVITENNQDTDWEIYWGVDL